MITWCCWRVLKHALLCYAPPSLPKVSFFFISLLNTKVPVLLLIILPATLALAKGATISQEGLPLLALETGTDVLVEEALDVPNRAVSFNVPALIYWATRVDVSL